MYIVALREILPEVPAAAFLASQRGTRDEQSHGDQACDTPQFPLDLVERLGAALVAHDAEIAMAATHGDQGLQVQPVFCLMKAVLMESLVRFTQSGQRKIDRWTAQHRCVEVPFPDEAAFFNANTPDELRQLQNPHG